MNKIILYIFFTIGSSLFFNAQAQTISVDPVLQNISTTDPFLVDILISDVADLAGFEFDLEFDSSILMANLITSGDIFFGFGLILQSDINAASIEFSEVSLLPFGINIDSTPQLLASIEFKAIGAGTSDLALTNVVLSDSVGGNIPVSSIQNGQVVSTVPEPTSLVLLMMGFFSVFKFSRKTSFK